MHEALELTDDGVIVGPAAHELVRLLDRRLQHVERGVGALGLEVRVLLPLVVVLLDELGIERPAVGRRVVEVVVGVHARDGALRVVLADRVRGHAEGDGARELHLLEHVVAQGLLVHGHVVAAPHRGHEEIRLGRDRLGDVRREVGRPELGPALGHHLGAGDHLLHHDAEVVEGVAAVGVVGVDVGDPPDLGPRHGRGDRARHAVRRLHVGDAEDVVGIRHGLVEEEVGAAVDEDREELELLGHRPERGRVAARDDAGEEVDLLAELHPPHFLDVGVGAGVLVGLERLDLPLPQETALGIDLVGGEHVALVRGLAEHGGGAGEEGHVADLVGRVRHLARVLHLGFRPVHAGQHGQARRRSRGGGRDRHAQLAQEIAATHFWGHVCSSSLKTVGDNCG